MKKIIIFCSFYFWIYKGTTIELHCNSGFPETERNQSTSFKTLQTSISEFVNKTDWTGQAVKQNEKINCSMYITVSAK
jgi:hypothetical protein